MATARVIEGTRLATRSLGRLVPQVVRRRWGIVAVVAATGAFYLRNQFGPGRAQSAESEGNSTEDRGLGEQYERYLDSLDPTASLAAPEKDGEESNGSVGSEKRKRRPLVRQASFSSSQPILRFFLLPLIIVLAAVTWTIREFYDQVIGYVDSLYYAVNIKEAVLQMYIYLALMQQLIMISPLLAPRVAFRHVFEAFAMWLGSSLLIRLYVMALPFQQLIVSSCLLYTIFVVEESDLLLPRSTVVAVGCMYLLTSLVIANVYDLVRGDARTLTFITADPLIIVLRTARLRELVAFSPPSVLLSRLIVCIFRALFPPLFVGLRNIPRTLERTTKHRLLLVGNTSALGLGTPVLVQGIYQATGVFLRPIIDTMFFRVPFLNELLHGLGAVQTELRDIELVMKAGHDMVYFPGGLREMWLKDEERSQENWINEEATAVLLFAEKYGYKIIPVSTLGINEGCRVVFCLPLPQFLWTELPRKVAIPSAPLVQAPSPAPKSLLAPSTAPGQRESAPSSPRQESSRGEKEIPHMGEKPNGSVESEDRIGHMPVCAITALRRRKVHYFIGSPIAYPSMQTADANRTHKDGESSKVATAIFLRTVYEQVQDGLRRLESYRISTETAVKSQKKEL